MKVDILLNEFINWAEKQENILGVFLVGSQARGAAKPDSDVDIVIITKNPKVYLHDNEWIKTFGEVQTIKDEDFKLVQVRRVYYVNGLEVEFGITTKDWIATNPVESGTRRVITDGVKILVDKEELLQVLINIVRGKV